MVKKLTYNSLERTIEQRIDIEIMKNDRYRNNCS